MFVPPGQQENIQLEENGKRAIGGKVSGQGGWLRAEEVGAGCFTLERSAQAPRTHRFHIEILKSSTVYIGIARASLFQAWNNADEDFDRGGLYVYRGYGDIKARGVSTPASSIQPGDRVEVIVSEATMTVQFTA